MPPQIAALIFAVGILGLFWLNRNQKVRTSGALWIPLIWLSIVCSRPVGEWLQMGPSISTAHDMEDGSPLDRLVWSVLLALGLIVLCNRRKRVGRFFRNDGTIVLFLCYCVVSFLWSDFPDVAFKRWIKTVGDLVMILIVLTDREPVAAFHRLLERMAFILVPLSVLFIKYYPNLGVTYFPWGGRANFGGVTTNKNSLGVISLCFGLWAWWRFLNAFQNRELPGRKQQMIAHGAILAMVFWLFHTSNSMTSLSSFLMAGTLLLAANSRAVMRRPATIHILIVLMVAVSASVVFFGASPDALKALGRDPTLTDRTEIWGKVLGMTRSSWFGTGFESFWLGPRLEAMWTMYWWHPQEAHDGYIEIFITLGWTGVALLVLVIASGYRTVFRAWHNNLPLGSLRLAYFFIGLVYNYTEAAFFRMQAVAWIFFVFAIVDVPWVSYQRSNPSSENLLQDQAPILLEEVHTSYWAV